MQELEKINIKPYIVKAEVLNLDDNSKFVGEVIEDRQNGETYHIKSDGIDNWYSKYLITILNVEEEFLYPLTAYQLELYVNYNEFKSNTPYFIWVDLYRMQVYIFKKSNDYFFLEKRFLCSPGSNNTPTKRGNYTIVDKGSHFYSKDGTYLCYNWLKYSGTYLFHSFPYTLDNKIMDSRLQERVSNGCVRLNYEDSLYLYENIPLNTAVWIN